MNFNTTIILALFASASQLMAAGGGETVTMPDFTKGGTIPEQAKLDWNLGATGMRGWMFIDKLRNTSWKAVWWNIQPPSPVV